MSLCKTGERLRQEGNWIFPSSKREGCPRRRQEEKGREAEIDLRLEINILNQQIAVILCFNNVMGKKDPVLTEPMPPAEGRLSVAEQGELNTVFTACIPQETNFPARKKS